MADLKLLNNPAAMFYKLNDLSTLPKLAY